MNAIYLLTALTPILAILILLVVLRLPAQHALPLSLGLTALTAFAIWRMPALYIAASTLEGLIISVSILWILFGAVLLLNTLTAAGAVERIRAMFFAISPDQRVQAIIVAWLFGAFIEGAAGFGTPAAITAPLMVALGFPPLAAVVLALTANSSPVTFGALGTPLLIGMGRGLQVGEQLAPVVAQALPNASSAEIIQRVGEYAIQMDLGVGLFIPLIQVLLLTRFFGPNRSWKEGLAMWRFALFAGASFLLPAFLVAHWLGPEFPSLLGGLFGMLIVIPAAQRGFLLPKTTWQFPEHASPPTTSPSSHSLLKAWLPYLFLTLLLVLTRLPALPFKSFLQSQALHFNNLLGTPISTSLELLYLPGTMFVATAVLSFALFRLPAATWGQLFGAAARRLVGSAIALGAALPMVRIFINSGVNALGLESMPVELAYQAARLMGTAWPLAAPAIGSLGSFLAGSATFSNMMFSLFQVSVAAEVNVPALIILALQALGANAGNMVCVLNVVAAASLVGLSGKEGVIIRLTLIPMLYYILWAGILGWSVTRLLF